MLKFKRVYIVQAGIVRIRIESNDEINQTNTHGCLDNEYTQIAFRKY